MSVTNHTSFLYSLRGATQPQPAPVLSELDAVKQRYLKATKLPPEAIDRFDKSGSYYQVRINPIGVITARLCGSVTLFMGYVVDQFTTWQLDELADYNG